MVTFMKETTKMTKSMGLATLSGSQAVHMLAVISMTNDQVMASSDKLTVQPTLDFGREVSSKV